MDPNAGIITNTVNMYTNTFSGYINQFIQWGEWLFYGCATIAIVWLCLWKAFDSASFQEAMPGFIREFFVIAFFYTLMLNGAPWLTAIATTATVMGTTLTHQRVDPSSIISSGIAISNLLIAPVQNSGLLTMGFGTLIIGIAYIVVFLAFLTIALDLALTIILTTFLISLSGLMLAFAIFPFTRTIARNTLDAVIGNSFKLLCLYTVIAAGNSVFQSLAAYIPTSMVQSFDVYGWVIAAAMLFSLISKNLPLQVASLVSKAITEHRGASPAAMAGSAMGAAQMAMPSLQTAAIAGNNLAQIAGSTLANTAAHFDKASLSPGGTMGSSLGAALGGTAKDVGGAIKGNIADQFKAMKTKLSGGEGGSVSGFAQRMHEATQDVKSSYSPLPKSTPQAGGSASASTGSPNSAGSKAAAPSSTRSASSDSVVSRPKK